jgi:epoxyqueuosine reductase
MILMSPADTARRVKHLALALGFDRVGIAPAAPIPRTDYFDRWLAAGHAGRMEYLHRHRSTRANPAKLLDGAKSVVVLAQQYHASADSSGKSPDAAGKDAAVGKVARYAWGKDYHRILKRKLWSLIDSLRTEIDAPFEAKPCVDTAPIIERELAAAAGIGWIGKNTMVLNEKQGSYFFLCEIITTLDLPPDTPIPDHCGSCTRCLDACPTQAFPNPYEMDASRCISYLTIELRDTIPISLRPKMGDWLFGCDVCQEVCPYNADPPPAKEPAFTPDPRRTQLDLLKVLNWSEEDYRKTLRHSAAKRAKLPMLRRNAAIALGNQPSLNSETRQALKRAADSHESLLPEAQESIKHIAQFIQSRLPKP